MDEGDKQAKPFLGFPFFLLCLFLSVIFSLLLCIRQQTIQICSIAEDKQLAFSVRTRFLYNSHFANQENYSPNDPVVDVSFYYYSSDHPSYGEYTFL